MQLFVTERDFAGSSFRSQAVPKSGEQVRFATSPWSPPAWAVKSWGQILQVLLLPLNSGQSHLSLLRNPS